MKNNQDRDPSYSLESEEIEDSIQGSNVPCIQQQQPIMRSDHSNGYDKYFSVHGNFIPTGKFPYHIYLKQRYNRLSLEEQIRIFQDYFDIQKSSKQLIIDPTHIQILNESINLFAKVPKHSMLFLTIQLYNQSKEILTLKNYKGQIIHFKIQDKNRKRMTTILQIRRRLKDNSFLIILDKGVYQCNWFNKKNMNKLKDNFKFLYLRKLQNEGEQEYIKNQFFLGNSAGMLCNSCFEFNRIYMNVNFNKKQLYAYSADLNEDVSYQRLQNLRHQLSNHIQFLQSQQTKLIIENTNSHKYKNRLRIFDYLCINFIKTTGKSKQQFIQIIKKMSIKYAHNLEQVQSDKDHFPDKILNSKRCKHCQVVGRQTNNKSKYKCLGCSKKYQVDIPLCIQCWGDFHEEVIPICGNVPPKAMKKAYQAHIQRKCGRIQRNVQHNKSSSSSKYSNNQQVRNNILKLNQNMTEIEKLMDQLQSQSSTGAKLVKQFNEVLFLNIIDSFNTIMLKIMQQNQQHKNKLTHANMHQQQFTP